MTTETNKVTMDQDCTIVEVAEVDVQQDIYTNCCKIIQFD